MGRELEGARKCDLDQLGISMRDSHLRLEFFELFIFSLPVFFYLFLGLCSGILDSFRAVYGC